MDGSECNITFTNINHFDIFTAWFHEAHSKVTIERGVWFSLPNVRAAYPVAVPSVVLRLHCAA